MRIRRLYIENILSIESANIDFLDSGLMLIDGWNHDTQSANGAGKSSIFNALSWGLFGEYPRGISVSAIVRNGSRKSKVIVEVVTSTGQTIKAERHRPNQSRFFKNDDEISEPEFKSSLGVTYDQFLLGQYFAQGLGQRFIDLNDSGRKDLILTLMKANAFTQAKTNTDSKIKQIEKQINHLELGIASAMSAIEAYRASIDQEKNLLDREAALKESIRNHIDSAKKINKPDTSKLLDLKEKYNLLYSQLKDLFAVKGSVSALRQNLKDIDKQEPPISHHDGNCPNCGVDIDYINGHMMLHDSASFNKKLEEWKKEKDNKKSAILNKILSLESQLLNTINIESEMQDLRESMLEASKDIDQYDARQKELKSLIDLKVKELELLKSNIAKNNELHNKIKDLSIKVSEDTAKIETLSIELNMAKTVSQAMSPTGIPAYILDSVVDSFNDKVRQYLQYIWSQASYTLNTFKENKSGGVSAKLSDSLSIDGVTYAIGSLSGGERRCLAIAIDFAILDVISQYTGSVLSPVILDEPFDHLDASNRARCINLLRELSRDRLIVVIDHASESKSLFDSCLMVNKKSGISYIS